MPLTAADTANLHPDLIPHVSDEGRLLLLHHPLIVSMGYDARNVDSYNDLYESKLSQLREAEQKGQWASYINLHERPYRMQAFMQISERLDDDSYWQLMRKTYVHSENISQDLDHWTRAWESGRPGREANVMTVKEREVFESLPEWVIVYRGFRTEGGEMGLSWTLNRHKAAWFARRFKLSSTRAQIAVVIVHKSSVLAYLDSRGEAEIVLSPNDLFHTDIRIVTLRATKM